LTEKTLERHLTIERRHVFYLIILGAGFFLLVPKLIGFRHALELLLVAHPVYFGLVLGAEILRYFASAASTMVLACLFSINLPLVATTEAFFGGGALNRTFSTGGAPGMVMRFAYLTRQGVHAGAVAAIFVIEDIIGVVIGGTLLVAGIVTLTNALPPGVFAIDAAIAFGFGSPLLILIGWYLYRHRRWVEQCVYAITPGLNRPLEWLVGRPVLTLAGVQHALGDFYAGMHLARRAPLNVAAAFAFNVVRYAAGAAALYFAFFGMQWTISPGALILIYTAVSVMSSVSAVPGEVAIMGTSFALLSLTFGVPGDIALMSLMLSRTIAFWLPMPVGYAALWHLRRKHLI
jgi:uncharacterized protein (TIRG00374 family)